MKQKSKLTYRSDGRSRGGCIFFRATSSGGGAIIVSPRGWSCRGTCCSSAIVVATSTVGGSTEEDSLTVHNILPSGCSRAITFSTVINVVEMNLNVAIGRQVDLSPISCIDVQERMR